MATALEKIQKKLRQLESGGKLFWKAEKGENEIRVCPRKGKNKTFYIEVQQHYVQTPEGPRVLVCREDQKCRPCKKAERLAESNSTKKQKRAVRMMPKTAAAMVIYDLKNKPEKPQIWSTTENNLHELLGFYADSDIGDFTDPKRGYNIKVRRKGEKLKTRYKIRIDQKPSKFKRWKKIKRHVPDLEKFFQPLSPKKQQKIMDGEDIRDNDRE